VGGLEGGVGKGVGGDRGGIVRVWVGVAGGRVQTQKHR
jgi:hypothetical protein